MRGTTKKRRRRAVLLLILLITGIAVLLKSGVVTKRIQREETKKAVAAEVEALHEKADRDGIVEETPNPYFIRKQPGYSYPKPKLIQYDSGITHTGMRRYSSRRTMMRRKLIRCCTCSMAGAEATGPGRTKKRISSCRTCITSRMFRK